ncbi:MAG: hypothetical protein JF630_14330 [Geodermatophilales bacterium]|nr:hypothetical protein [Geodermatophilales bacterium]
MRVPTRLVIPALVLASSLLAGCGSPGGTQATSTSRSTAAEGATTPHSADARAGQPSSATSSPPAFPANLDPDTADASPDARVTVSNIRVGVHDGFDRVVLEVGGAGTPGWDVRYVDQATSQGSGEPIDIAGDAVLQVTLTGAAYPYDTGVAEYYGAEPLSAPGTKTVTEVVFDGTFEGTAVAFVGTSRKEPFRVYMLQDPSRVVIDVAHSG